MSELISRTDPLTLGEGAFEAESIELLSYLLEDEAPASRPAITPRPNPDEAPLSFGQERLWFLEQLKPGTAAYHIVDALALQGPLQASAFERSLNDVIRRHEALRTNIVAVEGRPRQIIHPARPLALPVVDLCARPAAEREAEVRRLIQEETRRPFDLGQDALLRLTLVRLEPEAHVLVLCMHHLIADGWSISLFCRELADCYTRHTTGLGPAPSAPALQYADYAHWQRQWVQSQAFEDQLAYWVERLQGCPQVLSLPTDKLRPSVQSWQGARRFFTLAPGLVRSLRALGQRENATLFMTLLAAFNVLLHRYAGQTDILLGTPVANRNRRETESIMGVFLNTLVLRSDLAGSPTFRRLLAQVRQTTLEAFDHQDLPFEVLLDRLRVPRDTLHTPLFQVMFVFQNVPEMALALPGIAINPLPAETETSKFDLTLTLEESGEGLRGILEYNTDLFEAATIDRMAGHFRVLLEGIAADPDRPLSALPILPDAERRQLLEVWNPASALAPAGACLHQLVERQAARTPQAIAIILEHQRYTYGELNQFANQLAHFLQTLGVTPGVRVGLYLDRSIDLVIAILAVLKAGGAYVPIDLSYPKDRVAFMLDDARAQVLLTQSSLAASVAEVEAHTRTVYLDTDWPIIDQHDWCDLEVPADPDQLAYIIYTSGSTGRPKGVMVTHANVTRLFDATAAWYHFDRRDVWTLFHSSAFDFSVWEIWGALIYGGRLVVVPYAISRSPDAFLQLLSREQVTVLNQTPSAFRQLIAAEQAWGDPALPLALRLVIFGGEALDVQSLRPWFERRGDRTPQLVNMYGITETTVHVSYRPITFADLDCPPVSPIGRPIPDLQVYVLDGALNPMPIGVPGELYVGGAGLARGYLNRPDLTAERFIPDPFVPAGARLYKTGDLARLRPDGQLEYLGRGDDQVKVRGFRIELGEIESALSAHPAVRETVVLARVDARSEKQLVAYLVPSREHAITVDELRSFLKQRLPEYMVPAAFMMLPELPLTSNGKVDRRALPLPGPERPELNQLYVAPATPVEKALAEIWAQVLGVAQIGAHDNFFALGGDSIRSVQVVALARARGLTFSLEQFFNRQTIVELAGLLETARPSEPSAGPGAPFSLIADADRQRLPAQVEDAYPLSMLQAGMLYHMALMPFDLVYHNVDSFHLSGPLEIDLLAESIQAAIARHPVLRTGFDLTTYGEPLQLVHAQAPLPLAVEDLRHLSETEQEAVLLAYVKCEKQRPFDLAKPPLLRFQIHLRTDTTFQLTLTECHAIFDGWSLTSTLAEIFDRYAALLAGARPAPAAPLAASFRDFIQAERQALDSPECRAYWIRQLARVSPLRLPRHSTPPHLNGGSRMQLLGVPIPPDVVEGLNRLVRAIGVPLKSVLLAAHLKVMSLMSGQIDVTTGLTFNGRPDAPDGDQVRGLFLNTLPFAMRLQAGSWVGLARAAFEAEREALPFRRYPLAALQKLWGRQPLLPVTFNFVHFHALESLQGPGPVRVLTLSHSANENHFALTVSFSLNQMFWQDRTPLGLALQYDRLEFSEAHVATLGRYYVETLRAMAAAPEARHEQFSPLLPAERQQILVDWNATHTNYPKGRCIHELFELQARQTPQAEAVIFRERRLTYRILNERANRLAHYLRKRGVGPETLVGLCVERSLEMVIGVLGILKAGAAYVPLDPAYPKERLAFMLEDTAAPLLLTQSHLLDRLPPGPDQPICLDTDWPAIARFPATDLPAWLGPDSLAYVMYTSGSTGIPKGIEVPHRGVVRLVKATSYARMMPDEVFLQLAPISFDAATLELWGPLLNGGRVVLFPDEVPSLESLGETIERYGVTTLWLTAGLFHQMADEHLKQLKPLRQLLAGGDVLSPSSVRRVLESFGDDQWLINGYGPTENTTFTCCFPMTRGYEVGEGVPIGRPIANTRVYVLDAQMHPVPVGVAGELYTGGEGLGRGYRARPDLTAEKFVPDPFSREPGARLYRTGDLVRYLSDGNIEFLGRIDPHQVKMRGFRIELGEIESVLGQHPAVQEVVVTVCEADRDGHEDAPQAGAGKRLAAYVVPGPESDVTAAELRLFLKAKLPDYMLPSAFCFLKTLPLTPNGKVDRRALPRPETIQTEPAAAYVAPETRVEKVIADVWQACLGVERVGLHDNFFDLGGHSLLVIQAHSKLRQALEREFSVVDLFQYPTVSLLARHLAQNEAEAVSGPAQADTRSQLQAGRLRLKKLKHKQQVRQSS